jgi:hypothetical protein
MKKGLMIILMGLCLIAFFSPAPASAQQPKAMELSFARLWYLLPRSTSNGER